MEAIGPRTKAWFHKRDQVFRKRFSGASARVKPLLEKYMNEPKIVQVQTCDKGVFTLHRSRTDTITVNGRVILDSSVFGEDAILHWFSVDRTGQRLAVYHSQGSDLGVLHVLELPTMRSIETRKQSVSNVVFTDDDYYKVVRIGGAAVRGSTPRYRVFRGEREVFGSILPDGVMIDLAPSSDGQTALVNVIYGWSRSAVYVGDLYAPDSWKEAFDQGCYADPIDYVDGELYVHARVGMGRIYRNNKLIYDSEKPLLAAFPNPHGIVVAVSRDGAALFGVVDSKATSLNLWSPGFLCSIVSGSSYGSRTVLAVTGFNQPYCTCEYKDTFKVLEVRRVFDFPVTDVYLTAPDGIRVHGYQLGDPSDKRRVVVYGYGGFSISMGPDYNPLFCSLVDEGVAVVVTNIRGGSEYGEDWHRLGMRGNKPMVFEDFNVFLKAYRQKGYAVAAMGRSNGGLLVSATLVRHPESIDAAVIGYPVIDMLRFHKLYVGALWISEYGDPDNESDRAFLKAYSPYHNIEDRVYPPTMVYTGLSDDRVHPAHAFKFVAKMEKTGSEVYLRVDETSGHLGSSLKNRVAEYSDIAGFIISKLCREDEA